MQFCKAENMDQWTKHTAKGVGAKLVVRKPICVPEAQSRGARRRRMGQRKQCFLLTDFNLEAILHRAPSFKFTEENGEPHMFRSSFSKETMYWGL